jgi:ABC-type nitrate/sulfonate/bicarbonate transport system ATPase subunit
MSTRPGTIKSHLYIDLERPRKPNIVTSERFVQLKKEALSLLSEETLKVYKQEVAG